jgi:hypothetical protein
MLPEMSIPANPRQNREATKILMMAFGLEYEFDGWSKYEAS